MSRSPAVTVASRMRTSAVSCVSSRMAFRPLPHAPGECIHGHDNGDENDAKAQGERQISFRCFERDGGCHDAREAVNIAADDHDRADFGGGASEAGEQDREERKASVPDEGGDALAGANAHGVEFLLVFGPEVFDYLAGKGGDDGCNQDGLGDNHGARREEKAELTERA